MMSETIIEVKDVHIKFNLSSEKIDNLKELFIKKIKQKVSYDEFWALKGISFDVNRGDSIGLIGLNGCGKSTLLKVIAGVLKPTKGEVRLDGVVTPLIELGAGFDMDLTAKENIYLNGAILGHDRKFMDGYYNEIVEFSELQEFMDVPIKNFSSGMVSRLAFSIATIGQPEILIVDEVLSVGDIKFQIKCQNRIGEMMKRGATVLFVSHSIDQVEAICNKVVWIEKGKIKKMGEVSEICEEYRELYCEDSKFEYVFMCLPETKDIGITDGILGLTEIVQRFEITNDMLKGNEIGIDLKMATFNRVNKGRLLVELIQGNVVESDMVDMENIKDNSYLTCVFPRLKFQRGEAKIKLYSYEANEKNAVAVHITEEQLLPPLLINNIEKNANLIMQIFVKK